MRACLIICTSSFCILLCPRWDCRNRVERHAVIIQKVLHLFPGISAVAPELNPIRPESVSPPTFDPTPRQLQQVFNFGLGVNNGLHGGTPIWLHRPQQTKRPADDGTSMPACWCRLFRTRNPRVRRSGALILHQPLPHFHKLNGRSRPRCAPAPLSSPLCAAPRGTGSAGRASACSA